MKFAGPVTRRLELVRNAPLEEYRFAASVAAKPATVTLIGPDRIGQRYAYEESLDVYPGGLDEFLGEVVRVEREIVGGLAAAGCRYVHMDAPGYTAYVDEDTLAAMRGRGEDPAQNLERSIPRRQRRGSRFSRRDVRHPPLPRQQPQPVAPQGAATKPSPRRCSEVSNTSAFCSSTTTSARAASNRCVSFPRGRSWCWG